MGDRISWVILGICSPWWVQGWECPLGWGLPSTHRVPQDCDNATCVGITCHVPSLGKDQRALVSVHALLWMDTLQQVLFPPGDRGDGVALWPQVLSPPAQWSPERTLGIPCVGSWVPCSLPAPLMPGSRVSPCVPRVSPHPSLAGAPPDAVPHPVTSVVRHLGHALPRPAPGPAHRQGRGRTGVGVWRGAQGQAVVAAVSPTCPSADRHPRGACQPRGRGACASVVGGAGGPGRAPAPHPPRPPHVEGEWAQGDTGDAGNIHHGGGASPAPE